MNVFDSSKYLITFKSNISPYQKNTVLMLIPLQFNHLFSESHQKNIWAQPYFCLGCLLKSATDKLLLSTAPAKSGPLDFPSEKKNFLLFFAHKKVDGRR